MPAPALMPVPPLKTVQSPKPTQHGLDITHIRVNSQTKSNEKGAVATTTTAIISSNHGGRTQHTLSTPGWQPRLPRRWRQTCTLQHAEDVPNIRAFTSTAMKWNTMGSNVSVRKKATPPTCRGMKHICARVYAWSISIRPYQTERERVKAESFPKPSPRRNMS